MDSRVRAIVVVAALGMASLASGGAAASTGAPAASLSGHAWGRAIEVPGLAALNGAGEIDSVSCASAGNCSAGGIYADSSGSRQAFVVSQVGGTWHKAIEVPGTAALNQGGFAKIDSVSCGSAGNCSAGGDYTDSSGHQQAFVVSQVGGTWHKAIEVPGTAALNQSRHAEITSVSCASAGNCSAGGAYQHSSTSVQAFVVSEVHGTWHTAIKVPGAVALNQSGDAVISSVSCAAAGNCSAGGSYTDSSNNTRAFVVSEVHGTWHKALKVTGTAALNQAPFTDINSVSCGSAGNCSAGGTYGNNSTESGQAFVVSQVNGTWHKAIEVPGTAALNQADNAGIGPVSCASAGNCSAGGSYRDSSGFQQAFVVSQVNGTWHKAIEVPGTAALNQSGDATITSVSCASAGNCSAGGYYINGHRHRQAFVVSQVNGTWQTAIRVPGIGVLNHGGFAQITSVSCASAGECSAGGTTAGGDGAFVVSET
jgi:hypothetical protein